MKLIAPLALIGLLSACASLVPSTLYQLQALDPLTADPAAIEVMLELPPGLEVAPNSAILTLQAEGPSGKLDEGFVLVSRPIEAEETLSSTDIFRLAQADIDRMKQTQAEIARMKQADNGKTRGSLSVALGGCGVGNGPSPDARASVFIRTEPGASFLPLIKDVNVRQLIGPDLFDAIRPCNTAQ